LTLYNCVCWGGIW